MYNGKYSELESKSENELERLSKRYESERDRIMEDCLSRHLSFDEYEKEAEDVLEKLYFIDKYRRFKKNPVVEYGKKWKGELMTTEEFVSRCRDGYFIDDDGYGYYATVDGKSNVMVIPSDITEDLYRSDFTHVLWFNR